MMEYKGYLGRVEFDEDADTFHGEVLNTRDVITFQGSSVKELRKAFRDSVDDYLDFCKQRGEKPDKPYSGQFVARIDPKLHRKISLAASVEGKSLNAWVAEQLESRCEQSVSRKETSRTRKNRPNKRVHSAVIENIKNSLRRAVSQPQRERKSAK